MSDCWKEEKRRSATAGKNHLATTSWFWWSPRTSATTGRQEIVQINMFTAIITSPIWTEGCCVHVGSMILYLSQMDSIPTDHCSVLQPRRPAKQTQTRRSAPTPVVSLTCTSTRMCVCVNHVRHMRVFRSERHTWRWNKGVLTVCGWGDLRPEAWRSLPGGHAATRHVSPPRKQTSA